MNHAELQARLEKGQRIFRDSSMDGILEEWHESQKAEIEILDERDVRIAALQAENTKLLAGFSARNSEFALLKAENEARITEMLKLYLECNR